MFVITSTLWIISGLFMWWWAYHPQVIALVSESISSWLSFQVTLTPYDDHHIFNWYLWLANFIIAIWPGLPIIFHWKSPSFSAVERYFSVVRPFNQLRNRFFFRFKIWPKYFFCRGFCDPPWRSRSPAFSSPSFSLSPTISCSPQCASKHKLRKLAEFVICFLSFSLLNYSPACNLFYFSLQGASCAFWLPPEHYISSG